MMKIVFIDDEDNVLNSLKRSLFRWLSSIEMEGCFFNSAKEAINFVRENQEDISIIISDQMMPDLPGSKLLKIVNAK